MPWILRDVGTTTEYTIVDPSRATVSCELLKLNEAKVQAAMVTPLDVGTEVKIRDDVVDPTTKAIVEGHELLHGKVQKYAQITKGVSKNTYEFTIKELAVDLEKFRVNRSGSYTVNCSAQDVSTYAATVLYNSTWSATTGCPGSNVLTAQQFRYMTGLAGLNKVITELGAASAATPYYLWFYSADKKVGWGEWKADRTSVNFIKGLYYNYEEFKTNRTQASGVVIYGANSAYSGQYPAVPSGHDLAVYQYDEATSDAECAALARRVYEDWCKDPKRRIQFCLRPVDSKVAGTYIQEGDRIQVDGTSYTIMDMTYSPKEVLVGVNAGEDSVLYSLGDKLKPIAGTSTGASEISWAPGVQNVSSDNTTLSEFVLEISDKNDISSATVPLNVEIGPYKVYSFQSATPVSNDLLSDATVPAYYGATTYSYSCYSGTTVYMPISAASPQIKSATMNNGFQYAIATVIGTAVNASTLNDGGWLYITCQYSYNGSVWYNGTHQGIVVVPQCKNYQLEPSGSALVPWCIPFNHCYLIQGYNATTQVYVRWKVYYDDTAPGAVIGVEEVSCMMDVVPRHSHNLVQSGAATWNTVTAQQGDDLSESDIPPPSSITCIVNGGTPFTITPPTSADIKTQLITGKNTIAFRSTTVCTVTPSAVFQMFGV